MFGIGFPELIVILGLALIVLGPDELPKVARKLASFIGDLRRTASEFQSEFQSEIKKDFDVDDLKDLKIMDQLKLDELKKIGHITDAIDNNTGWKEASSNKRRKMESTEDIKNTNEEDNDIDSKNAQRKDSINITEETENGQGEASPPKDN